MVGTLHTSAGLRTMNSNPEDLDTVNGRQIDIPETFGGVPIRPIASSAAAMGTFMAIYGAGGVGKTTIIGEVARSHGPLLYVDAEGGGKSIKHIPNVYHSEVTRWAQIEATTRDLANKKHPFKVVCYDNMSEIQNMCKDAVTGGGAVQIQHWGEVTTKMLKLTRDLREISRTQGVHVFLVAWDSPEMNESGVVTKRGVGFTPSLARQFPGIVTYVGYLQPLDDYPTIRRLSFTVSTKTDAKFRASPSEAVSTIPLELFERSGSNVLGDIINTESHGAKFPADKYGKPAETERTQTRVRIN